MSILIREQYNLCYVLLRTKEYFSVKLINKLISTRSF